MNNYNKVGIPTSQEEYSKSYDQVMQSCMRIVEQRNGQYNQGEVELGHYFYRGVETVLDICHLKVLRARSAMAAGNHEVLMDSLRDLVNYAAFGVVETIAREHKGNDDEVERLGSQNPNFNFSKEKKASPSSPSSSNFEPPFQVGGNPKTSSEPPLDLPIEGDEKH